MTESGERWLKEAIKYEELLTWHELASPLSRRAADFWIRAVFQEIERRATEWKSRPHGIESAFDEVKKEFLG